VAVPHGEATAYIDVIPNVQFAAVGDVRTVGATVAVPDASFRSLARRRGAGEAVDVHLHIAFWQSHSTTRRVRIVDTLPAPSIHAERS